MSRSKPPLSESSVLVARDPSLTNTDDWPEFRLNEATVTLPASSKPVSLLLASEHHPVRLTGQVEAVAKKRAHLWVPTTKPRPTYIEIAPVQSFAYDDSEGTVDLWAAGKAGWFKIKPSEEYQVVYDDMVEAVKIMYFIVDAYKTPRKSGRGKNATILPDYPPQELFAKYAVEVLGVEKGAPEAQKKMYKHRDFLLSSMILEKEGMKWGKNPLYMHLIGKFREEWKKIKQRLEGTAAIDVVKDTPKEDKPRAPPHTRQESLESASTTSSRKRKRGRPPKTSNTEAISIESSSLPGSPAIETAPLVQKDTASTTAKAPLKSKQTKARSTRSNPVPSEPEIEDSQATTPAIQDSDVDGRRRRKSALRLKPNKPIKGPPKKGYISDAVDDDEEDELSQAQSPPPRLNGTKRKRDGDLRKKTDLQRRPSKRTNSNNERQTRSTETVDEGIDIPTSPSSDAEDAIAGADATNLPIRKLHQPDQLQENTWTCALDGCTHKVYGPASAPETQKLIREHYALHAYDDDERIQMVKRMAEPSLPTNYLVEKVRGFVGLELKRMDGTKVGGSRFPETVKTKY